MVSIYETQRTKVRTSVVSSAPRMVSYATLTTIHTPLEGYHTSNQRTNTISGLKQIAARDDVQMRFEQEKLIPVGSEHKNLCLLDTNAESFKTLKGLISQWLEDKRLFLAQGTPECMFTVPKTLTRS